jgi:hypothetical protein
LTSLRYPCLLETYVVVKPMVEPPRAKWSHVGKA